MSSLSGVASAFVNQRNRPIKPKLLAGDSGQKPELPTTEHTIAPGILS
jgi:hypothetical protein